MTLGTLAALTGNSLMAAPNPSIDSSWSPTSGLSWGTAANWTPSGIAGGVGTYVVVGSSGATITLDGARTVGRLELGNVVLSPGAGGSLTFDGNGGNAILNFTATSGQPNISGPVTLATSLDFGGSATLGVISGVISGSGGINVNSGLLRLSTANLFSGGVNLNGGFIDFQNSAALGTGTVTFTSGTLKDGGGSGVSVGNAVVINGDFTINSTSGTNRNIAFTNTVNLGTASGTSRTITIATGGTSVGILTISGVISNGTTANKLIKAGGGTMILTGPNTYTGGTTISAGTFQLGVGGIIGTLSTTGAIVNNGNFTINRSNAVVQGTDFSGSAITGTGSFTKLGSGTTTLNATNTYSGGTTVGEGTLTMSTNGTLGAATGTLAVNNTNVGAGKAVILNLATAIDTTTGSLSGTVATPSSGTNSATINNATGRTFTVNQTTAGSFAGVIAGAGNFSLGSLSTNTLTLTGINTYTGTTTINAGTLLVNGSLSSSSAVTVNSGGSLGGSSNAGVGGNVAGAVSVDSGGTLTPGATANSLGILNTGALSFASGSFAAFELQSSSATADLVNTTGNFSITNGAILTLADIGTPSAMTLGTILTLVDYSGTWNGGIFTYLGSALADDTTFTYGSNTFLANYNDGTAFTLTTVAVPEPSTYALLGVGLLSLYTLRRKSSKNPAS